MLGDFEVHFQAFRPNILTMLTAKLGWLPVFIYVYNTEEFVCLISLTTESQKLL